MNRSRLVDAYIALVIVTGCSLLVWLVATSRLDLAVQGREFWVFALLLLVSELFPISVPRKGGEVDVLTASMTFAFALLIAYGTAPAVTAQVFASVAADAFLHKSPWKVAFNAGQFALSMGAAGAIYHGLGGGPAVGSASLVPFVLAAFVFFVLNTTITDIAAGAPAGSSFAAYLWKDLIFEAQATLPLLALAPLVVTAADASLWLVPLAAAPAVAVWWGARLAFENAQLAGQLQTSLDQEKELNRLKDDFVAMVSHELRTPLTSIQGYVKTLLQLSPELSEAQRHSFLEAADRQGDRLRRLIEQLLVVGRLDSHTESPAIARVDLGQLVEHVVDELAPRANGHAFDVRIAAGLGAVMTDESKVHQILSNLVENALKYSPERTRICVVAEPGVKGLVVSVTDEGPGIPPEAREKIFDRFYQVDQTATRRVGGTGLGLYICRRMAEAIGGRLWLARSDEGGSAFSLFIPSAPPASGAATPSEAEAGQVGEDPALTSR
jgi:signal transduction histidine kinase